MIGLDALVDFEFKDRVFPGDLNGIDDLVIKLGANEADFVTVLDGGEGQCGGHDTCTEHCNPEHLRTSEAGLWPDCGPDTIHANVGRHAIPTFVKTLHFRALRPRPSPSPKGALRDTGVNNQVGTQTTAQGCPQRLSFLGPRCDDQHPPSPRAAVTLAVPDFHAIQIY